MAAVTQGWLNERGIQRLTDEEILSRYGDVLAEGISAFRADPSYVVDMAEEAARLLKHRRRRSLTPQERAAMEVTQAQEHAERRTQRREVAERRREAEEAQRRVKAERTARILALYEECGNYSKVAREVGMTMQGVRYLIRKSG